MAKKIDTMANVSILCGNCTCMVTLFQGVLEIISSFPNRCVLSITTDIGLPAKFDTLAIVSNFLPESSRIPSLPLIFGGLLKLDFLLSHQKMDAQVYLSACKHFVLKLAS